MNIIEAANQLVRGYRVRRKFWLEVCDDLYLQVPLHTREIVPMVFSPNYKEPFKPWCPTTDDVLADDWEVIDG